MNFEMGYLAVYRIAPSKTKQSKYLKANYRCNKLRQKKSKPVKESQNLKLLFIKRYYIIQLTTT